jgi:hypothetical protein
VFGIGALVKARGKKAEDQAQEQQTRKPQHKPSAGGGILGQLFREIQQAAEGKPTQETRPSGQTARQQTIRPQAAVRKDAAETKQSRQTAPSKSKLSKPIPQAQPDFDKLSERDTGTQSLPEITTNVVGLSGKRKRRMPSQSAESSYLSEVLFDYEDPDELKRAILYYEILGKPLALRDT